MKNRKYKKLGIGMIFMLLLVMALGMTAFAAGNTKTMKNKKWVSGKCGAYVDKDHDGTKETLDLYGKQYYKIQIPKQGYIMVDVKTSDLPGVQEYRDYHDYGKTDGGMDVWVLNAKKKGPVFVTVEGVKNGKFSYAVKKGTYYLAVKGDMAYKLRYTFTSVEKVSKAGKGLSKAVAIKKGATIKNLLVGEDDHYYKLTLKKKGKVVLVCNSKMVNNNTAYDLGSMIVQMWTKKGKDYKAVSKKGIISNSELGISEMNVIDGKATLTYTLPKGTYYLRAYNVEDYSGYYTIKWK